MTSESNVKAKTTVTVAKKAAQELMTDLSGLPSTMHLGHTEAFLIQVLGEAYKRGQEVILKRVHTDCPVTYDRIRDIKESWSDQDEKDVAIDDILAALDWAMARIDHMQTDNGYYDGYVSGRKYQAEHTFSEVENAWRFTRPSVTISDILDLLNGMRQNIEEVA